MSCENNCVKDYRKKNPNLIYECRTKSARKYSSQKLKKKLIVQKKLKINLNNGSA
jgi:hypothetical protein